MSSNRAAAEAALVKLITEHDLPREAIPTDKLNSLEVWEALLEKMPMTAMVRNLGKMTSIGLLKPLTDPSAKVCAAPQEPGGYPEVSDAPNGILDRAQDLWPRSRRQGITHLVSCSGDP